MLGDLYRGYIVMCCVSVTIIYTEHSLTVSDVMKLSHWSLGDNACKYNNWPAANQGSVEEDLPGDVRFSPTSLGVFKSYTGGITAIR